MHPQGSGNSAAYIYIDMYGSGSKPIIAGGGVQNGTVYLYNQQYWEIGNLEVTNQAALAKAGLFGVNVVAQDIGTAEHIHISNLDIHDVNGTNDNYLTGAGIVVQVTGNTTSTNWDDVVIENNTVHTVDRVGILMWSTWGNRYGVTWVQGPWSGATKVVIQNNKVYDIGGDGILPYITSGALIQHNVVHHAVQRYNGPAGGIWTGNSDNDVFQ